MSYLPLCAGKNRWLSSRKTHDIHQLVSWLESSVENRKNTSKCGWNPGFAYRRAEKITKFRRNINRSASSFKQKKIFSNKAIQR